MFHEFGAFCQAPCKAHVRKAAITIEATFDWSTINTSFFEAGICAHGPRSTQRCGQTCEVCLDGDGVYILQGQASEGILNLTGTLRERARIDRLRNTRIIRTHELVKQQYHMIHKITKQSQREARQTQQHVQHGRFCECSPVLLLLVTARAHNLSRLYYI